MADDRWIEIEDDFTNAVNHFRMAVQIFNKGDFGKPGLDGYIVSMAFMHSMQSGHTSLESGLKRILTLLSEDHPSGDQWHSDLIRRAAKITIKRPPIFGTETAALADQTRRFRHVATKSYDGFNPEDAKSSVIAAQKISERLLPELQNFKEIIDPEDPGPTPLEPKS